MEINFGSNIGMVNRDMFAQGVEAQSAAAKTTKEEANLKTSDARNLDALASSEPVSAVPDSAIARDDDLGKLMQAAFNLPPPPMPAFG